MGSGVWGFQNDMQFFAGESELFSSCDFITEIFMVTLKYDSTAWFELTNTPVRQYSTTPLLPS